MKITNEFTVPIPVEQAWTTLTDLEGIAPCLPGAQLTGVEGEVYQGRVKVKVGPVISDFSGTARFTSKDDAGYRAVIDAKGRDARAAGNASATISASLTAEGEHTTRVSVDTDLKISGKLAQFGSGMIKEVSSKLLAQFVANLEAKLATETPASASTETAAATETAADTSASAATETAVASAATETAAASAATETAADTSASDTVGGTGVGAERGTAATPPIAPDLSAAGDVEPAAGRLETAEGTPEPSAPLRAPGADLSAAAAVAGPSAAAPAAERNRQTAEPEAIDLLAVAGGSIYKRVVPVAVGAVVVAAVIVWFVARR